MWGNRPGRAHGRVVRDAAPSAPAVLLEMASRTGYPIIQASDWAEQGDANLCHCVHRANKPWSIGSRASGGCIRMFNEDVERLWDAVPEGTPVTIVGVAPGATWDSPIPAGASGWNVPALQWALRRSGFDGGRADGRMGSLTMQAVAEAQRQWGLPPVAAATPDLFRALGLRR